MTPTTIPDEVFFAPRNPLNRTKSALTRTTRALGLFLAFGLMLHASSAIAQTTPAWSTVDDMFPEADADGIAVDRFGNIFVVGNAKDASGVQHAVVMKSSDRGQTWDSNLSTPEIEEPADDYISADGSTASFYKIAAASIVNGEGLIFDHLVTVGQAEGARWLVRRSTDAGATWTNIDLYTHPNPRYAVFPRAVAVHSTGDVYVVGTARETITSGKGSNTSTSTVDRAILRRLQAGVWSTLDLPAPAMAIICVGESIFTAGNSGSYWQVSKSSDGGNTWAIVDNFRYDITGNSYPGALAADTLGNVYAVGSGIRVVTTGTRKATTSVGHRYWIVRKGSNGGTSWSTSDVFELGPRPNGYGAFNLATSVAVDHNNDVHVTGVGVGADVRHWVTRQRSASTGLWSTSDDFAYGSGFYTDGWGIAADPAGNIFAHGLAGTSPSTTHHGWLVRRKLVPTP